KIKPVKFLLNVKFHWLFQFRGGFCPSLVFYLFLHFKKQSCNLASKYVDHTEKQLSSGSNWLNPATMGFDLSLSLNESIFAFLIKDG
ncbi:MAG TPA: hypothetical protein VLA13_09585, partial [Massilibacterium sp.]|nr:hypothetical protein [Massilibacterium sp.]